MVDKKMIIQFENENKRPFKNCTEKSIKITKIEKWWIEKNENPNRKCK